MGSSLASDRPSGNLRAHRFLRSIKPGRDQLMRVVVVVGIAATEGKTRRNREADSNLPQASQSAVQVSRVGLAFGFHAGLAAGDAFGHVEQPFVILAYLGFEAEEHQSVRVVLAQAVGEM